MLTASSRAALSKDLYRERIADDGKRFAIRFRFHRPACTVSGRHAQRNARGHQGARKNRQGLASAERGAGIMSSDTFHIPHSPFRTPNMPSHLFQLVAQIPRGRVTTYGDLARALGNVMASRWVGQELLNHDHHSNCHCHRVVRANGDLGVYSNVSARDGARSKPYPRGAYSPCFRDY